MDEHAKSGVHQGRKGLRRGAAIAGILLLALVLFHRPILSAIGRAVAIHYAAKADLKLDLRVEGSFFGGIILRNVHILPTAPTSVESIDIDYLRADYSLFDLARHRTSGFVKNVEVRTANVVLNTDKTPVKPKIPHPDEHLSLPPFFPDQLRISDLNLIVRTTPREWLVEHLYLTLTPSAPGELRVSKFQIPNGTVWRNIAVPTSYTHKNLIVRGLVLDPANQVRLLALDASHLDAKKLELVVDGSIARGTVAGSIGLSETKTSLDSKFRLAADGISLDALAGYVGKPAGTLAGEIVHLAADGSGTIDAPRSWNGQMTVEMNGFAAGALAIDSAVAKVTAQAGRATLTEADLVHGSNHVHASGWADLPPNIREFGRAPADVSFTATMPDLATIGIALPQPISGNVVAQGRLEIADAVARGNVTLSGKNLGFSDATAASMNGIVTFSKRMPPTDAKKLYYDDLQSETHLEIANLRSGDNLLDAIQIDAKSADDLVTLERLSVVRKTNSVAATGDYRLPADPTFWRAQPAKIDFTGHLAELADFWIPEAANKVSGPLQVDGQLAWRDSLLEGEATVFGVNLNARGLPVPQLSAQMSIAKSVVYLNDFTAQLNTRDFIAASAEVGLTAPHAYRGKVSANIADLATLRPVLQAAGNRNELGGTLALDWQGSGSTHEFKNRGDLKLKLERGRYGNAQDLRANIDASYSPEGLDVPTIFLANKQMDFQASLQAKGSTLEISKVQVDQGAAKYATGYVSLPFVWSNLGSARPLFPPEGKVVANLQAENLDLRRLFEDVGIKPQVSGLLNVKFDAQGTLDALQARLDMQMRDLRSEQYKQLEPASFDLSAQTQNRELVVAGTLKQAKIQPLRIDARLPFDAAKIAREQRFDEATPISAKVQLPRSSVNFLRQFVPAVQELDGDLALDVNVGGTIAKPVLSGSGDITINVARFNNPTLPALHGFKSRMNFARETLTFERFGGDLAGGPFTVGGRVVFRKLTDPELDFQLRATSVLVARNDNLTARADADIRVLGPLNSARVTGNVALTNSQFLKNIDLIPIGLPGRPAPQPPSDRPDFSIPNPPLRDWKFDVAIKTKDPFLIRGNLANGGAITDLHLLGTGLHPGLQGTVRLENVEATLPFSRLEIAYGFLYFDPSDSFNPKIDLHGTSLIRDYTVHVYVYGTSLAPEAVFTSEPPLPQEEIISLLATGTTREELTGNNNVLAGRAAMLLVQQLYRKVFKKGQATKSNSVFDRLQVDVGNVDPRTGQQTASARYKINDQFVVVGDIGVGGDFRGLVKYLIRFR